MTAEEQKKFDEIVRAANDRGERKSFLWFLGSIVFVILLCAWPLHVNKPIDWLFEAILVLFIGVISLSGFVIAITLAVRLLVVVITLLAKGWIKFVEKMGWW